MLTEQSAFELADSLSDQGQFQESLDVLLDALKSHPASAKLWANAGWSLFQLKKYDEAANCFTEALRLKPAAPTTLYFRAQCREKKGVLEEALDDYQASAAISPRADTFISIGLIHKFRDAIQDAEQAFTRAIALDPQNKIARGLLDSIKEGN